jgi:class 3 adenylate cyclase
MSISADAEHQESKKEETRHDDEWRQMFTDPTSELNKILQGFRNEFMRMTGTKRCTMCAAPFDGDGPLEGRNPNSLNPNFCNSCDGWMKANFPGRVIDSFPIVSFDMRGSSAIAREHTKDGRYQDEYEDPFMAAACQALVETDGFIIDTRGDELRGLYPAGFSGKDNVKKAWNSALFLLANPPRKYDGTLIKFKIAVHIGDIAIGSKGKPPNFLGCSISGDGINTCSHMCSHAGTGEALISEIVFEKTGMRTDALERKLVPLKGDPEQPTSIADKISVYVVTAESKVKPFEF